MKKFSFVILHYMAMQDTIECIDSILENVGNKKCHIIVVDNGSNNNSIEVIKDKYCYEDRVITVENNINLGFAKGNNIGYRYAKDKLKSDFIIMLNNDTIIQQKDFIELIENAYNESKFSVLGPDILSVKNNVHQNPLREKSLELDEIKSMIKNNKLSYIYTYVKSNKIISKAKNFIFRNKNSKIEMIESNLYKLPRENIVPHGACVIFSPLYIKAFEYAFYPETFLYAEEDILYHMCNKKNLKIKYDPKIKILHKEDVSTETAYTRNMERERFILKHKINSLNVLYNIVKEDNHTI